MMFEGDQLGDHKLYDFEGDLKYIELVHEKCGIEDNRLRRFAYWEVGPRLPGVDNVPVQPMTRWF